MKKSKLIISGLNTVNSANSTLPFVLKKEELNHIRGGEAGDATCLDILKICAGGRSHVCKGGFVVSCASYFTCSEKFKYIPGGWS